MNLKWKCRLPFDIMPHLVVHLAVEVDLASPIHTRWLHFLERYMLDQKNMVKHVSHPNGSMTKGYLAKRTFEYEFDCAIEPGG